MLTHMEDTPPAVAQGGGRRSHGDAPAFVIHGDGIAAAGKPRDLSGASASFLMIFAECAETGPAGDATQAAARAAGWRDCDLAWERLQERALDALRDGDTAAALRDWQLGWRVALLCFRRDDPRYAASQANLGLGARLAGREGLARRRYAAALRRWGAVSGWIDSMTIARRGRSSLFHLKSEALHWGAYDRSLRGHALRLAGEVAMHLDAASRSQPPPARLCDRWPGEKPTTFDDLRKFLGGALLIAETRQPDDNRH
ncbi:tetratricopeptide repeat-containing protein [Paracoccus aminovorans]|uniref:tetratricopeptide repeat-containing protein n=1 Tax=Paracoccus aminovorans TaxID=34004 RepID=UPI002B25B184|nr:tetratricopeptide repeat-containing protein [Paracoccus aminovorans]